MMEAGKANPTLFLVMVPMLLGGEENSGTENEPNCTFVGVVPFGAFCEGPM